MKVFISHIHEEAPLAIVFKEWIESSFPGLTHVFVSSDIEDIPAGSKWLEEIDNALEQSHVFLVLCSPVSLQRPWINFETGCAWIKRVPVLPICHSGQKKSTLLKPLSEFQALEIDDSGFINDLLSSLAKHLNVDRIPRIDKSAMLHEISETINKFIHFPVLKVSDELDIPEEETTETEILKRIVNLGDKGYSLDDLARDFGFNKSKMEFYLDNLVSRRHLKKSAVLLGAPSVYTLTKEGRRYLVSKDLL